MGYFSSAFKSVESRVSDAISAVPSVSDITQNPGATWDALSPLGKLFAGTLLAPIAVAAAPAAMTAAQVAGPAYIQKRSADQAIRFQESQIRRQDELLQQTQQKEQQQYNKYAAQAARRQRILAMQGTQGLGGTQSTIQTSQTGVIGGLGNTKLGL